MEERDVTELLHQLRQAALRVWVDGGWGVDALLSRQTRPHSDLDLVVDRPDLEGVQALLLARGYQVARDWLPNAIAYRDAQGRQVDLHPVDPTADGGGRLCHLGYPPRATDFDDMRRLGERFGLQLPEPFGSA